MLLLPGKQAAPRNSRRGRALLEMGAVYATTVLTKVIISPEHLFGPEAQGLGQ